MPTYVAQPQASRAGLITTIVILCILTVLMTALFFVRDGEVKKAQADLDGANRRYAEVITADRLSAPEYAQAKEDAKKANLKSVYDLQVQQQRDLAAVITGQDTLTPADASNAGRFATEQNNKEMNRWAEAAGIKATTGNSLTETLKGWPQIAQKLVSERDDAVAQTKAAQAATAAAMADNQKKIEELNGKIKAGEDQLAAANAQVETLTKQQAEKLDAVSAGASQSTAALQQQMQAVQQQVAQLTTDKQELTKYRDYLLQVLRRFKANNLGKENILNVPDGVITAVSGNECFINLGEGDQITRGMTFEVYDPIKGIPALGEGTSTPDRPVRGGGAAGAAAAAAAKRSADRYQFELPKGKGSIEVVAVGPGHQSTCRVIHTEEGQTIGQGDLVANLVYDKNIKTNWVIFGEFDFNNGSANARANDAPVVARLISQWGGNVQPIADPTKPAESITAETDFVVVGREPTIPNFTAEEAQNPENAPILDRAKARMGAYQAVLAKAAELGIPVMNQNRFLYYVGYFDQARR